MSVYSLAMRWMEQGRLPDWLVRRGIRRLCAERLSEERADDCEARQARLQDLIDQCRQSPVALHADAANEQHYEVPADFYQHVLGRRRKYSCCYWPDGTDDLDDAEQQALATTCQRAEIEDGQTILELGCGWGSLTLWMAEQYPGSTITAVSNSASQREYILAQAEALGLENVSVLTADMNRFDAEKRFDRVVSVEMFEHMRNYETLTNRIADWLVPGGKLFVHIFCHRNIAYPFGVDSEHDWMGRHFFTGGIMPSDDLLLFFQDRLAIRKRWNWSGVHYQKTAEAWLANLDRNRNSATAALSRTYGAANAETWFHRWRVFFMACAELFGYENGRQWYVSHYLFQRR